MKILVTGGSGFLGKAFIKKYRKTFNILAPTHAEMDLLDARSLEKYFSAHDFDAVVHLAGAAERPGHTAIQMDNLIMFKNIQYMSIAHGIKKLVIVGEGVEFDRQRPIVDIAEDSFGESIPTDGYGLGRYLISLLASKDKITTQLRIFDVYGEGGGNYRINKIVSAGSRGKKNINIDRDRVVSAVSVDDAVKVIAEVLKRSDGKAVYNVVADEKTSYLAIAKCVKRLVRKDGGDIDISVKNPEPDNEYSASNALLRGALNVRMTPTLKGVKALYESLKPKRRVKLDYDYDFAVEAGE